MMQAVSLGKTRNAVLIAYETVMASESDMSGGRGLLRQTPVMAESRKHLGELLDRALGAWCLRLSRSSASRTSASVSGRTSW